jgi:DNA-binding response OmpR family regulator
MSLLLAEDHPGSGPGILALLSRSGYRVALAQTYDEAWAALASMPRIVLADEGLPGGSGLDIIREARRTIPGVVCGLMTGKTDPALAAMAEAAGADFFLAKPVDFADLLRHLPPPLASTAGA